MKQNDQSTVYDFESQLELGELLLGLGRIEDAEIELRKARELNEIGAYRTSDNDPKRQEYLQRLAIALERVESIQGRNRRNSRIWWFALTGIMGTLLTIMFVAWAFDRNARIQAQQGLDGAMVAISTERTQIQRESTNIANERTTVAKKISDLVSAGTISGWEIQRALEVAKLSATQAAQIIATVESRDKIVGGGNNTGPIVITVIQPTYAANNNNNGGNILVVTATPGKDAGNNLQQGTPSSSSGTTNPSSNNNGQASDADKFNQLRVRSSLANVRWGPGFEYGVRLTLVEGNVVKLTGQSQDGFWYKVVADGNIEGWMHTSLAKPVGFDELPILAVPTYTPGPTLTPDSGLMPTRPSVIVRPTEPFISILPTQIPIYVQPTETFVVQPTQSFATNTPAYPTWTPVPPATATKQPATIPATTVPSATASAVPQTPNATDVPPTNTAVSPTNTAVSPTNTAVRPTNTAVSPTNTPIEVSSTPSWSSPTPVRLTPTTAWASPTPNWVAPTVVPIATVVVTPLPTKTLAPTVVRTSVPTLPAATELPVTVAPNDNESPTVQPTTESGVVPTPAVVVVDPIVVVVPTIATILPVATEVAPAPIEETPSAEPIPTEDLPSDATSTPSSSGSSIAPVATLTKNALLTPNS